MTPHLIKPFVMCALFLSPSMAPAALPRASAVPGGVALVDIGPAGPEEPQVYLDDRRVLTVVDGARSETDAWEVHGHRPLMISGVVLHSLPAGYRFDLRRRERIITPNLHAIAGGEAASS